eukprot:2785289-Rhodomonas_salina.3
MSVPHTYHTPPSPKELAYCTSPLGRTPRQYRTWRSESQARRTLAYLSTPPMSSSRRVGSSPGSGRPSPPGSTKPCISTGYAVADNIARYAPLVPDML